jgi:ATP-binding cassette subfamily C (CFTR/MRP) protein 10
MLHAEVGSALIGGVGVILLLIPVNFLISTKINSVSKTIAVQRDTRVASTLELIQRIGAVKLAAAEERLLKRVGAARAAEWRSLATRKYLDALCVYFWATTPILVSLATFGLYSWQGHALTPRRVFTSLALLNQLVGRR